MKKILALFIAVFLLAAVSSAIAETKITVSGTGEVRVSADTAVISLGVNARDKDVLKAQQNVNETIAAIRKALIGQGGKEEDGEALPDVILATVRGDIHDIGKNIVKMLLQSYGFKVLDLGKDVPEETVVNAWKKTKAPLVGLSALMTTTVPSMKRTIEALKAAGSTAKVAVGGAVLTKEYAAEVGADYYGKDALETVKIAQAVIGK